jgi:Predicted unsaturated glucuronyl hydrolase involved in regulation of bacterial surface properties, and related proteins
MKLAVLITVATLGILQDTPAQTLPRKASVLGKMVVANNYFMKLNPDPSKPIVTDKTRPSNIWTRSVYYEGLMALYKIDPKPIYLKYAVRWARSHQWDMPGGTATRIADNQCCGQTYIDLYCLNHKLNRIKRIKDCIGRIIASDKIDDWWWIDALQMAMPVFAKLGKVYHDDRYFKRMYEMYSYTKQKLYNPRDGLWWRDSTFLPPYKEPNGQYCYWSRGKRVGSSCFGARA